MQNSATILVTKINRMGVWFWLFLLALLARAFIPEAIIEAVYSRIFFAPLRWAQGWVSGLSPFPLVYILIAGLAIAIFRKSRRGRGLRALSAVFFLAFTFMLFWGFHYQRVPFVKQAGLQIERMDEDALQDEFEYATCEVLETRSALPWGADEPVAEFHQAEKLEKMLLPAVQGVLRRWGYPANGKVRARLLYPKGILMRFSSSGVYLPWTGEGHVDAGLHPLSWPFVMAHEMSHGYGMPDEGVCNFLAYQVCSGSEDPYIRYAGALYYWRYASSAYFRVCPAEWEYAVAALPEGVRGDLIAIREYSDRYPDLIPQWRDVVYDTFLKSQGLREGVLSYDNLLALARAWRKSSSY